MFTYTPRKAPAAPTTKRAIFTCKNKECKHVWAFEYQTGTFGGRKNAEGKYVGYMQDMCDGCPKCGGHRVKGNIVRGRYSPDHICDGRCMSARGPDCECSCGGANHGRNYL